MAEEKAAGTSASVTFGARPELISALDQAAVAKGVSRSDFIRMTVIDAVRSTGFLPPARAA